MEKEALKRYNRQILLEELGTAGQEKLQKAAVLVIGSGGLGCPLLFYLAGAGIGKIGVVDGDTVDESNLHRQILFQQEDLGKNKALKAIERLKLLNPSLDLQAYPFHISSENAADLIQGYELIIDGSDNFPTRYLVNDTCVSLKKPLVFGSIFRFEGQVSVFNYQGGPNYRNCYPEPPAGHDIPNCAEAGVIGPLPGIIGSMMANEAIKVICGFGDCLSGKLLIFNALNYDMQLFNIQPEEHQDLKSGNSDQKTEPQRQETEHADQNSKPLLKKAIAYEEVYPEELLEWEANKLPFCLIDVREAHEFEMQNIGGIHISLYELGEKIDELPFQHRLVFCCTSGGKSRMATKIVGTKRTEKLFIISLLNQQT
ncbi:HesA/MoeB/ThiF family protein [Pedobacter gandavensis]|uniref:Thiamine biosynthesis protein ThiF n=1 Tax=Pedobacter gandavensis TaxID=2679963 RepID=A0ABR6F0A4_9SPHI|nr:HesA/MoeB/ThiF family protein [Pedobacter gandavensis]MBB2150464.1 thiamine biosynthesis protein ThiF [Pedobacter gandavensis]